MFRSTGTKISVSLSNSGKKLKDYLINLFSDYKTVATETVADIRAKPWKGVGAGSLLGGIIYAVKTNPDEQHFRSTLVKHQSALALIGDPIRSSVSNNYVQSNLQLFNENRIGRLNFVLFSVIWRRDYGKECELYAAQCKVLKPSWRQVRTHFIDIGACRRWLNSELSMKEYDVNQSEFST